MFENKITNNHLTSNALLKMGITEEIIKENFLDKKEIQSFHIKRQKRSI